jgi:hypothetical protein
LKLLPKLQLPPQSLLNPLLLAQRLLRYQLFTQLLLPKKLLPQKLPPKQLLSADDTLIARTAIACSCYSFSYGHKSLPT